MPPTPFEPRILLDAATDYNAIRSYTEDVIRWLATALDTYSACAGSDNAGKDWAEGYDRTAIDAVAAGMNIANASAKLHDLLAATWVNYINIERSEKIPAEPAESAPHSFLLLLHRHSRARWRRRRRTGRMGVDQPANRRASVARREA